MTRNATKRYAGCIAAKCLSAALDDMHAGLPNGLPWHPSDLERVRRLHDNLIAALGAAGF